LTLLWKSAVIPANVSRRGMKRKYGMQHEPAVGG